MIASELPACKAASPIDRYFATNIEMNVCRSTSCDSSNLWQTVDTVILADAANRAATDARQWYVTISRGRKKVIVYTPDKKALRAHVQQTGDRELALDLKRANKQSVHLLRPAEWARQYISAAQRISHVSVIAQMAAKQSNTRGIHL